MADAVKKISVQKGNDITRDGYILQCFGGAGGQHACAVADALGLNKVMIHPFAGALSAYGIGLARAACTKMKSLDLILEKNERKSNHNNNVDMQKIEDMWKELENEALQEMGEDAKNNNKNNNNNDKIFSQKSLLVRYVSGDSPIEIFCNTTGKNSNQQQHKIDADFIWTQFEQAYSTRYAHLMPNDILIVTVASVEVIIDDSSLRGIKNFLSKEQLNSRKKGNLTPISHVSVFVGNQLCESTPLFDRNDLIPSSQNDNVIDDENTNLIVKESSIIVENLSTIFVDQGWTARCDKSGVLWLERKINDEKKIIEQEKEKSESNNKNNNSKNSSVVDPLRLEIMGHLFMNIAEQMGLQLQNTAWSVNIKERLDFSCAIFDSNGALIANAPHIPVHLGSMGLSIRKVLDIMKEKRNDKSVPDVEKRFYPEDVFIVNDPFAGGTHLPDITLVVPVFAHSSSSSSSEPSFFVASRGHHADVGGATPGSLPPFSKHIDEEGVRLAGFRWRTAAVVDPTNNNNNNNNNNSSSSSIRYDQELKRLFVDDNPMPARNFEQNLGDLLAQVAANECGAKQLQAAAQKYGIDVVTEYMGHLLDFGEASVRRALSSLHLPNEGEGTVHLDNGAVIKVKITLNNNNEKNNKNNFACKIDFTGSSGLLNNNFNAPRAVTYAAILYSVRLLVADNSLPLNEGCLRPLEIIIPNASCLSAEYPAAVVAGNVEMSMCLSNSILHAFGAVADSQPTMNNFTFGLKNISKDVKQKQYYETICGGSGAGPKSLVGSSSSSKLQQQKQQQEGFCGASAIQCHMTNSRLTDVEILESRFPVRLEKFEIARGTGGEGKFRGGDGTLRCVRFLEPATICLLTNGRKFPARGLAGGQDGKPGENILITNKTKQIQKLFSLAQIDVEEDDCVVIQTPGGGGYLYLEK
jgi:5-oxoprolinase (ATP-hydrolysing)